MNIHVKYKVLGLVAIMGVALLGIGAVAAHAIDQLEIDQMSYSKAENWTRESRYREDRTYVAKKMHRLIAIAMEDDKITNGEFKELSYRRLEMLSPHWREDDKRLKERLKTP